MKIKIKEETVDENNEKRMITSRRKLAVKDGREEI